MGLFGVLPSPSGLVYEAVRVYSMPVGAWLFHYYGAIYQAGKVCRARRDHEV
jgi:hypothetical protein